MAADEENSFDEVIRYYDGLIKHINWNSLGMILAGGVNKIGDIEGTPALEEARKFGSQIK